MNPYARCVDAASIYCPCHLAEAGCCLLCGPCRGGEPCQCADLAGFCVYQELAWNGGRAKAVRGILECNVTRVIRFEGNVLHIRVQVPSSLARELTRPGSFVFVRTRGNPYYDAPISILFSETDTDSTSFAIVPKGIKTYAFQDLKAGDRIFVRGPFWNGTFGRREIARQHGKNALVICRGIGFLPSIAVIQDLRLRRNPVSIFLDPAGFNLKLLHLFQQLFEMEVDVLPMLTAGGLAEEVQAVIRRALADGTAFIHIGGSDALTTRVLAYLRELGRADIPVSCCNNARMCCGEGICGACTGDVPGRPALRLCKEQVEPYAYFERRFS